jgi:D-glycero-D-manno-heptose 1,7-bisphosphate phosphatase
VLARIFTDRDGEAYRPALFLDRDGVLNQRIEGGYVTDPSMLTVLEVTLPAIRLANAKGLPVVVVSNQGAIARRLLTVRTLDGIHAALLATLADHGAHVDGIYVCPHHPAAVALSDRTCSCRKPAPGLFLHAAAHMRIDLRSSMMIGDQPSDRAAAAAAGLSPERVLVLDGQSTSEGLYERVLALLAGDPASNQSGPSTTLVEYAVGCQPGTLLEDAGDR